MAESTDIAWCDATFNAWWGCAEVSPGCGNCYARTWAAFTKAKLQLWPAKGAAGKGQGHAVMVTSDANWRKPLTWARLAREGLLPDGTENVDGHRPRIFTASMADVFEERPELGQPRERLFALIAATPELDWLVLTKRPDYARAVLAHPMFWLGVNSRLIEMCHEVIPGGMIDLAAGRQWLPNLWMGVSIENARYTWRADVLREIPAAVRFISAEPLLGSLYKSAAPVYPRVQQPSRLAAANGLASGEGNEPGTGAAVRAPLDLSGIDWVIIGGESGGGARPFHLEHAREIIGAARGHSNTYKTLDGSGGIAVFVKQLGAKPIERGPYIEPEHLLQREPRAIVLRDGKGGDMSEWPADLRIREFPRSAVPA